MNNYQRALLTGATGFIGSHLTQFLVKQGIKVAVLVKQESDPWRIEDIRTSLKFIQCPSMNIEHVQEEILDFQPQVYYHLGWFGVDNHLYNDPRQIIENTKVGVQLLSAVSCAGCKLWVGLGSQAEYGPYDGPISEDSPTKPRTAYGVAKLCVALLSQEFCRLRGMEFLWLRLFSCYGPADKAIGLIPYVILSLLEGKRPSLTEGKQKYDYLYIDDVVEAIWQATCSSKGRGIFNLASGRAYTIREIATRIRDLIDPFLPLGFGEKPYPDGKVTHLEADITRLKAATGWIPKHGLDQGLQKTVAWFKENMIRCRKGI